MTKDQEQEKTMSGLPDLSRISELLNEKVYSIKYMAGIARNLISHWQAEGILDEANDGRKWRKFSLIDIIWMNIIVELRAFGFSLPNTRKVKEQLFTLVELENKQQLPLIEHCVIEAITYSIPAYLTIDRGGNARINDDKEYLEQLKKGSISNHIIISINHMIKENIRPLFSPPDYSDLTGLSEEETEVLTIIRNNDFQSIKVTKKNGAIDMIEGVQKIEGEKKIVDLLREGKYQNIEVKQSNGKVVSINRTVRKKIKR